MSLRLSWASSPRVTLLLPDAGKGEAIRLEEPLALEVEATAGVPDVLLVPAGFTCDGASIPRFAWTLIGHPLRNRFVRSAILHDWLCRTQPMPSGLVHRLFYLTLRADGVNRVQAWLMWRAVQVFGPTFGGGMVTIETEDEE